ncbi:MAG: rhomboid family intramembrane serine protease [Armatimonadetes bacterium]|nr:rhomboid family intramembrane serine protease [Armatimonadota bacterium]
MRADDLQYKMKHWIFHDGIPVTKSVIIANIITFLGMVLFRMRIIEEYFVFTTSQLFAKPWTVVTYPLVGIFGGIIYMLFAIYWLWLAGGSLERSWGSRTYAAFFFITSALTAFGLYVGSMLIGTSTSAAGLWLPIAAVTVAWAMLNPEQQILFMFFIPLRLKWVALISVGIVFIEYGSRNLILGVFALAGCGAAYWYAKSGTAFHFGTSRRRVQDNIIRIRPRYSRSRTFNPLKWYKEYRQRKRLEDLFKRSGMGD